MPPSTQSERVKYEDWLRMPVVQDAYEEVIDGEMIIIPPRKRPHASILKNVWRELAEQLPEFEYHVFVGNFGLVVSEDPLVCRNPDLAVFERATTAVKDGYYRSAPLLAVEDPDPEDPRIPIERKLQDYASLGTPEVWVLHPDAGAVEVFQLASGLLASTARYSSGLLKPRAFPNVQIPISRIWLD